MGTATRALRSTLPGAVAVDETAAAPELLDGLRVVLVGDDVVRTDRIAEQLRDAGSKVAVVAPDGRGITRAAGIDPDVVLIDAEARGSEASGLPVSKSIREHVRLRHGRVLRLNWNELLGDEADVLDRAELARRIGPAIGPGRALGERIGRERTAHASLGAIGPCRLIRAVAAAAERHLVIAVVSTRARARVEVAWGLVLSATWREERDPAVGPLQLSGLPALAAFLTLRSGPVVVADGTEDAEPSVLLPVEEALARAEAVLAGVLLEIRTEEQVAAALETDHGSGGHVDVAAELVPPSAHPDAETLPGGADDTMPPAEWREPGAAMTPARGTRTKKVSGVRAIGVASQPPPATPEPGTSTEATLATADAAASMASAIGRAPASTAVKGSPATTTSAPPPLSAGAAAIAGRGGPAGGPAVAPEAAGGYRAVALHRPVVTPDQGSAGGPVAPAETRTRWQAIAIEVDERRWKHFAAGLVAIGILAGGAIVVTSILTNAPDPAPPRTAVDRAPPALTPEPPDLTAVPHERAATAEAASTAAPAARGSTAPAPSPPAAAPATAAEGAGESMLVPIVDVRGAGFSRTASDAHLVRAEELRAAGRMQEAEAAVYLAHRSAPRSPYPVEAMARLYVDQARGPEAVVWAERAVALRSRRAPYHLLLGDAQQLAGDVAGARQSYLRAEQLGASRVDVSPRLEALEGAP